MWDTVHQDLRSTLSTISPTTWILIGLFFITQTLIMAVLLRCMRWHAKPMIPAAMTGQISVPRQASTHAPTEKPKESFIDTAKKLGINALIGKFVTTGTGFDRSFKDMVIERVDSEAGVVEIVLPVGPELLNSYGTLHGGASATLVDLVGTLALMTKDVTKAGVSVDLNVSFTSAVKAGDSVRIIGRVLKLGGKLGFTTVDIYRESDSKLVVSGRHTKAV